MVLKAIKYRRGELEILDQLKLPYQEIYEKISTPEEAWHAIKAMKVRGAPAIAIVAALSLAVWGATYIGNVTENVIPRLEIPIPQYLSERLKYLVTSRPTAVNLAEAVARLDALIWKTWNQVDATGVKVIEAYVNAAEQMLVDDVNDNENIGKHGAEWLLRKANSKSKISVLTHCNTGSLATAGHGTALGVIRNLHGSNALIKAFYTETRPYNQGSRLTGYEMIQDQIPAMMITDSMAAALLCDQGEPMNITAVIVGADRVAANGDTANKIGTYQLAIVARHHGIKFLVAAPRTTIDMNTLSGRDIKIEQRPSDEVTHIKVSIIEESINKDISLNKDDVASINIAAKGTQAWNPAFDITPAKLIDAIVTEVGVVEKNNEGLFDLATIFTKNEEKQPIE